MTLTKSEKFTGCLGDRKHHLGVNRIKDRKAVRECMYCHKRLDTHGNELRQR